MNYIREALKEDIGKRDITTELLIAKNKSVKAVILAKENGIVCGLGIAGMVFKIRDKGIKFKPLVKDGQRVKRNAIIARIQGKARSILTAERVALNFLALLSGVSTQTRKFVEAARPYKAKILDTRKTIPGLRMLEKYAVRVGGAYNHRMSLDEMILVKDNHLQVVSCQLSVVSLKDIIEKIRKKTSKRTKVEIEVKNLREFKEALKLNPHIIMLDNMNAKDIKKAVKIKNYQLPITNYQLPKLEASGGITLKNVKQIASTGVDFISVGSLTHSVNSVDISLEIL